MYKLLYQNHVRKKKKRLFPSQKQCPVGLPSWKLTSVFGIYIAIGRQQGGGSEPNQAQMSP